MGLVSYFKPKKGTVTTATVAPEKFDLDSPAPNFARPATGRSSRRSSMSSRIDDGQSDLRYDALAIWLHQKQLERTWIAGHDQDQGVIIKKSRDEYACCPAYIGEIPNGFAAAVKALNVRSAVTIDNNFVKIVMQNSHFGYVSLSNGLRIQVLSDLSFLEKCQKHQGAAFLADRKQLIVWDDDPRNVLARVSNILDDLMESIWNSRPSSPAPWDEKKDVLVAASEVASTTDQSEAANPSASKRRVVLWLPFQVAISLSLTVLVMGLAISKLVKQSYVDHTYLRFAIIVTIPAQIWLCLFFFQCVASAVLQLFGPVSQVKQNTKTYSGLPPTRLQRDGALPHVTIQMPVYKEGLEAVIEPTIRSIKAAISTYEMQGGTANIFINDDGMQLIPDHEAWARQDFYDENNVGWIARPKHNPKPVEGLPFLRRGKFKKASNMNYSLWVSNRVEDKLSRVSRQEGWSQADEAEAYVQALKATVAEDDGRTWADGNVRMGDYILIIDSDTRVPTDCFLNAVSEMEQCPEVGIIQYISGVMNVTDSYFEKGITFFTNMVYTQINFSVANGDVAPFVGHNAILRWSALQEIAYECLDDAREKFWSESTVSEDFDMALRLQAAGYIIRFGSYTGVTSGFKEGVSLTVYDELARWEKYAYGCSELVFHPFRYWFTKGPFTPLFRQFISSGIPFASKITILGYIGTYYAIASAWFLTLMNYFVVGWYNGWLDHYYMDSFRVYVAIVVVFSGIGNTTLAILRYRTGEKALLPALLENFMWIPLTMIFLGGISVHVFQAIFCHMFSIDMSWGATAKEVEQTTFFQEIPRVIKNFKYTFAFCLVMTIAMVVLAQAGFVPVFWRIQEFIAIYPLAALLLWHFLLPIVLNPNLMLFKW